MKRETKCCKKCGETKPLGEFYYNRIMGYYYGQCKDCARARARQNYHADPERNRRRYAALKAKVEEGR